MKIHVLFVLFIALIFNACNKKSLPPKDEEPAPVFYFKCDVGGFPVDIEAGVNSYYMKSGYHLDSNNVFVFKNELKQKECSDNCSFGLTVLINDYKVSSNNIMNIDSTLAIMSYQFNDPNLEPLYYIGTFNPSQPAQGVSYSWSFNDGPLFNNTAVCSRTLKNNTKYTATMHAKSSMYGDISHTNVYRVGNPVQAILSVTRLQPYTSYSYKFLAVNGPTINMTPPCTYLWDFGDGSQSTDMAPTHEYFNPGLYNAKLSVVNGNGDSCEAFYQVPAFNGNYGEANFNAYFTPVQNVNALSAISIQVTDPKGTVYSSSDVNQPSKSHFEIVSVENYVAADSNQPLKKIKIRFSCTVYHNSNLLEIKDGEAVIAVAYKN